MALHQIVIIQRERHQVHQEPTTIIQVQQDPEVIVHPPTTIVAILLTVADHVEEEDKINNNFTYVFDNNQ